MKHLQIPQTELIERTRLEKINKQKRKKQIKKNQDRQKRKVSIHE